MARRLRTTGAVTATWVLVLALGACSWGGREPGLFRTPPPGPTTSATTTSPDPPAPTNPRLPVVGEAVWTTADGTGVTVRFAVHAVRRTAEAAVLDWSVTPIAGPGRRVGDPLPSGTDLGLGRRLTNEQNLVLLDPRTRRAYRPLADVSAELFSRCLCTPLYAVVPRLRFGETRVLQLAFPPLPATTTRVDVVLPNVAAVPGVPVTPVGAAPVATTPTDLTRPAVVGNPVTGAKTYTDPGRSRPQGTVVVNRVEASRATTSVVWTLHAVDDRATLNSQPGPPVSVETPTDLQILTDVPASGPRLRLADGTERGARWTSATFAGVPSYECLCSGLGFWSRELRLGGGTAHLSTQVAPLPRGTDRVDVRFPGLDAFTDVPVTWTDDVADGVRWVEPGATTTWTYDETDPPRGWSTQDWPTPLPAPGQVAGYSSRPERVLDALPGS